MGFLDEHGGVFVESFELEKVLRSRSLFDYFSFYEAISELVSFGVLSPVRNSGFNGRNPPLYNKYRKRKPGLSAEDREFLDSLDPAIDTSRYRKKPDLLNRDRGFLELLDRFLKASDRESLRVPSSINERSFEIFGDEKFLSSVDGHAFLQNVSISEDFLNVYHTPEPFFFSSNSAYSGRVFNVLVIENKDTFYTIKRCFFSNGWRLLGRDFSHLVYGEGKKIIKSFEFALEIGLTPDNCKVFYFGDLDPEGISIFESFRERFSDYNICLFVELYEELLNVSFSRAPKLRRKQRVSDERFSRFLGDFPQGVSERIMELFDSERYLPQEGLNFEFFDRVTGNG